MKMKLILCIPALLILFSGCNEHLLDITPSDRLSDATVWNDSATANLFLNDIYDNLNAGPYKSTWLNIPTQIGNDPLADFTDDATYGPLGGNSYKLFDNSSYGPSNLLFSTTWGKMYAGIRKCNLFIEKVSASKFEDNTKKVMIAQARFLRAYFYKTLIDLYGGVTIITRVLDNITQGDSIFYPRSTYADGVSFIQTECEAAAQDLPTEWGARDIGKATRGAALAMKGEEELYAGKWQDAATTNETIIQSTAYSLFPDYAGLFYADNENNSEVIFDIQYAPNIRPKHINQYLGVPELSKGAGWGNCDPTQNLVDQYEYLDGKTAAEGSALYDGNDPYRHLGKRFYASIIYDGSVWRGKTIYTRLGIPNNPNEINVIGKSGNAGRTGYFMKKLQDSTISSVGGNLDGTNVIIFRYAEVLLNYAEAQNEFNGPDQTVYDAINPLRERAGLPDLPIGLDKDQMRERIRHERRIELAFEGKRFYDIRRWRIADSLFKQPLYGMKITGTGGNLTYEKVTVRKVTFDAAKNYLLPIPQDAIDQNPKLTQNPGY
jgi:hypothetical protein